jgi:large subunit ribosomal protein L17
MFRNQLVSLIENERIVTTLPKAKELRPIAEKVITHGKAGTVHARRWVLRWMPNMEKRRTLVKKVFDEIAPRFSERPGGYLRIVKLGPRLGDGAEMAVLEFVDRESAAAAPEPVEEKKGKKAAAPKASAPKATKKDKPAAKASVQGGAKDASKRTGKPKGKSSDAPKAAPRTKRGESS